MLGKVGRLKEVVGRSINQQMRDFSSLRFSKGIITIIMMKDWGWSIFYCFLASWTYRRFAYSSNTRVCLLLWYQSYKLD